MSEGIEEAHHAIETPVGVLNCYVQGKIPSAGFVILTVHDLGCNHTMWHNFVNHASMQEITKRGAYVHVDLPGQEDNAQPLPSNYKFPTMQQIADALPKVLDELRIKTVVGLGEGAGANILARFACSQKDRTHGIILLHCTGTTAGFMESIKDKIIGWKLDHIGINPQAEAYLVLHRFGLVDSASNKDQLDQVVANFKTKLETQINPHNLRLFVDSFMTRSNIVNQLHNINCDVLMVSGALASHSHTVQTLYRAFCEKMDFKRHKAELVLAPNVANVLDESPAKLAETVLYYLQGLGLVGSVPMRHVSSIQRIRTMSMEEADLPKSARSGSLTGSPLTVSPLSTSPPKEDNSPLKENPLPNKNGVGAEGDIIAN